MIIMKLHILTLESKITSKEKQLLPVIHLSHGALIAKVQCHQEVTQLENKLLCNGHM